MIDEKEKKTNPLSASATFCKKKNQIKKFYVLLKINMNKKTVSIKDFIKKIPKSELHLHIEWSFEPSLMLKIANRNWIKLKYKSVEELKKAYNFNNLQEFLDIYYQWACVLIKEKDFYDLTFAYFKKIAKQNVIHAEIFFDPQTHTERWIEFEVVIWWITRAMRDAKKKLWITSKLILSFLRHLDQKSAIKTLEQALPYKKLIVAVWLDSSELWNPPSKFQKVFEMAKKEWFLTVAHAWEEWPTKYIWETINLLKVSRIDHGNRCLEDEKLVDEIVKRKLPLTVCPLSNYKLKVVKDLEKHPLKIMMVKWLLVTINSDDPAYFGGYINENYLAMQKYLDLTKKHIYKLAENSFKASFIDTRTKKKYLEKLKKYYEVN